MSESFKCTHAFRRISFPSCCHVSFALLSGWREWGYLSTKKCEFRVSAALRRACEGMFSLSVMKALLWQSTKAIHQAL